VIYAVPGHPFIAEITGPKIYNKCIELEIPVKVLDGISFLEPTLKALFVDVIPQLTIVDALEVMVDHFPKFPPSVPVLIAQVHSKEIASELKITLGGQYPDEQSVILVHAAGTKNEIVEDTHLYQIDQSKHVGNLTSLYLPALEKGTSFEEFQELIAHLRSPEGCAWDREQDHQSLRTNLLEEMYEVLNAIDLDDPEMMQEEFGDLLLQVVLQTQIASEYGEFDMTDVISGIYTKLVRRHPHVFTDLDVEAPDEIIRNWEKIKEHERNGVEGNDKGMLDGVPTAMAALAVADNYQKRAARVGFDWGEIEGALKKMEEEIDEFRNAETNDDKAEEMGDMFFALANVSRWFGIDPESALRETNAKFKRRFKVIEAEAIKKGVSLSDMSLEEMDVIWEESKKGDIKKSI
jgi:tetrapyrrole methylase family protein/MazG family protein